MQRLATIAFTIATALAPGANAVDETLQNDGFFSGALANFQGGFIAGEIAAARFVPQGSCPCLLTGVTLLFGGSSSTQEMGLRVWDDTAGNDIPGFELFSGSVSLTGSNVNLQQIDLSLAPVVINGPFRVGLEFGHAGFPSVASDLDGTINAAANFILADIGVLFWFQSATLGVSGDFIIRASLDSLADADADGVPDNADNCTQRANADQRDTDGDAFGNVCDLDLNNDCVVNAADLGIFRSVYFTADADADTNGDGVVNTLDLGALKSLFFQPPGPTGLANACP